MSKAVAAKFNISAESVAERINVPLKNWPGHCSWIADAMLRAGLVEGGRLVRGNWVGPIAAGNLFSGRAFTGHTWIGLKIEGWVVDPTRWAFEGVAPYIYLGAEDDNYDAGGNRVRDMVRELFPYPDFEYDQKTRKLEMDEVSLERLFLEVIGDSEAYRETPNGQGELTDRQIFWIANLNPDKIGKFWVREIYAAIARVGLKMAIPQDNWRTYMSGEK